MVNRNMKRNNSICGKIGDRKVAQNEMETWRKKYKG